MASLRLKCFKTFQSTALFWVVLCLCFSWVIAHGGSHDDGDNVDVSGVDHKEDTTAVKIWCLVILLVTTFIFGISPYFVRWNQSFLLLGTQFAGGIFLSTSMIHFLSDSNETFGDLTTKTYPFAFMLACFGYLVTMFGDCIIAYVVAKGGGGGGGGREAARVEVVEEGKTDEEGEERDHHNKEMMMGTNVDDPVFLRTTNVGDTILLIAALCFHSVFEGIAIGVSATKGDAWRNLWTISLHKVFAAIAMGIALLRLLPKRAFLLTAAYSFSFAVSSPIGVGIGIAIDATTEGRVADWIYAISMGLACGVFIYVAINHLIAKGFKPLSKCYFDTPFYKFLAVVLGVGVIAVVMIWD